MTSHAIGTAGATGWASPLMRRAAQRSEDRAMAREYGRRQDAAAKTAARLLADGKASVGTPKRALHLPR